MSFRCQRERCIEEDTFSAWERIPQAYDRSFHPLYSQEHNPSHYVLRTLNYNVIPIEDRESTPRTLAKWCKPELVFELRPFVPVLVRD